VIWEFVQFWPNDTTHQIMTGQIMTGQIMTGQIMTGQIMTGQNSKSQFCHIGEFYFRQLRFSLLTLSHKFVAYVFKYSFECVL
jgi:hypothetical protein